MRATVTRIDNANIYDAHSMSFHRGSLVFSDIILGNAETTDTADMTIDADGCLLIPGFVDIHTHGRAGFDFTDADAEGLEKLADSYLSTGVTSLMPTLASAGFSELCLASDRIKKISDNYKNGAHFAGIHLEGRYLNPEKRGAHSEELIKAPDAGELEALISHMKIPCRITAALELDRNGGFSITAKKLGATLSLGHTCATYDEAVGLYEKYGIGFSHLFNAMPPLHHRKGGAVCAGLTCGAYSEIICDGLHIAPEMVRLAYSCLTHEKLVLITDSMEGTGCPDGEYKIAGSRCVLKNGMALTDDGALAGSTLDMKTAVENLMKFCGIPIEIALRCATLNPALAASLENVGSLDYGKRADILLVHEACGTLTTERIFCGGKEYHM